MGEFILTLGDAPHARRIVLSNRLADEGLPHLFGRIFPPYGSPANYIIGVSGRDLSSPDERPEYGVTGIDSDRHLTFANVTDDSPVTVLEMTALAGAPIDGSAEPLTNPWAGRMDSSFLRGLGFQPSVPTIWQAAADGIL